MAILGENEDVWGTILYEASWGGLRLDVLETDDQAGRATARHRYVHRDGADVEDLGGEPRVTRVTCVFFERPALAGEEGLTHYDRFRRLATLKDEGVARTFVHPLTGSYKAKIGEFSFQARAGERDVITCTIEFVEDTTEPAVFSPGAGTPVAAGAAEVKAAAVITGAVFDVYLSAEVAAGRKAPDAAPLKATTAAATTAAATWEGDDISVRDVNNDLIDLGNQIDALVDKYALAADVTRLPTFVALSNLRYELTKAAEAFTSPGPRLTEIQVLEAAPLLVIAARFYGSAAEAQDRADELAELNVVKNPARVPAGTRLKARVRARGRVLRSPR